MSGLRPIRRWHTPCAVMLRACPQAKSSADEPCHGRWSGPRSKDCVADDYKLARESVQVD